MTSELRYSSDTLCCSHYPQNPPAPHQSQPRLPTYRPYANLPRPFLISCLKPSVSGKPKLQASVIPDGINACMNFPTPRRPKEKQPLGRMLNVEVLLGTVKYLHEIPVGNFSVQCIFMNRMNYFIHDLSQLKILLTKMKSKL